MNPLSARLTPETLERLERAPSFADKRFAGVFAHDGLASLRSREALQSVDRR